MTKWCAYLYQKGEEPDPTIYQVLQLIPTDHVPEFTKRDAGKPRLACD